VLECLATHAVRHRREPHNVARLEEREHRLHQVRAELTPLLAEEPVGATEIRERGVLGGCVGRRGRGTVCEGSATATHPSPARTQPCSSSSSSSAPCPLSQRPLVLLLLCGEKGEGMARRRRRRQGKVASHSRKRQEALKKHKGEPPHEL
jgi:hypothetical protein